MSEVMDWAIIGADTTMHTCCSEPNRNVTLTDEEMYLPPEKGNFTITYDVTQAYPGSYLALVSDSLFSWYSNHLNSIF